MVNSALWAGAFWSSAALLVYTYGGYPLLITLLARKRPAKTDASRESDAAMDICVLLVAHNEERRIRQRVQNLLDSEYPADKLRIVVVSDGSTDNTAAEARTLPSDRVTVVERPARAGKAAGLNAGIPRCQSDLVVFADARQRFAPDTIARLAKHFSDGSVGAVSGSLEIEAAASSTGSGVDAYWRLEKRIRAAEARYDSSIGCTGAVYAIRRSCWSPLPSDTILDDVVIPMRIAITGRRVLHDPLALAFDSQSLEPETERRRKRRTLAGNFQMLLRYPAWLLPWRNRLWWQLLSHKYLRLLAPALLVLALTANLALAGLPFYRLALALQAAFYALALVGLMRRSRGGRIFSIPAAFVFLNATIIRAFWHYLRSPELHRWETSATQSPSPSAPLLHQEIGHHAADRLVEP